MPQQVNIGELVQVTPRYIIEGQQCENVLYFQCVVEDTDMLAHLLLLIAQCIITHLLPALGANVELESVVGKIVGPAVGGQAEWTPGVGDTIVGAATGDSEPSFVAAILSLRTARPGKSGHGRMYIGGIAERDTTGSLINLETPLWAALAAFVACLISTFPQRELGSAANYEWGIYSRKVGAVTKPPYPLTGYAAITQVIRRRELGTMRSRKLGHGK